MLDREEIANTIEELENGETNFSNCQKLAMLYIVQEHLNPKSEVEKELNDVLPRYNMYRIIKRQYQMGEVTKDAVVRSIQDVTREIHEFIHTLYSNTDMEEEREALMDMLTDLKRALD